MTKDTAMRIELVNGRKLVCGHFFKAEEIKEGQVWAPADGSNRTVEVLSVNNDLVKYTWEELGRTKIHEKEAFAFQCRYCKVIK
jgi:hypothetical protein